MKKLVLLSLACLVLAFTAGVVLANKASDGEGTCISVAPQTILLSLSTPVTVHSNIPYGLVDRGSIALQGIPATFTKADSCGHLVAKFSRAELAQTLQPGSATLTLTGLMIDGTTFQAADTVTVKE